MMMHSSHDTVITKFRCVLKLNLNFLKLSKYYTFLKFGSVCLIMDKNDAPASNSYLIVIYLTNWLACFSIGFSLIGYNTPGMVIEKQTGWSNNVTTYITTSCTIGLMCGSFACKFFLPYGRIRTIYFAQFLIMMSVVP